MKVTKFTIEEDKVFMFSCGCDDFSESKEECFKESIRIYLNGIYPDKGLSIYTNYERTILSALVVVDINDDISAEEIDI